MQRIKTTSRYTGEYDELSGWIECQICKALWFPRVNHRGEVNPKEFKCHKGCWEYLDEQMEPIPKEQVPQDDTLFWNQRGIRAINQPGFTDLGAILTERTEDRHDDYWRSELKCGWGLEGKTCHDDGVSVVSGIPPVYETTSSTDREGDSAGTDNPEMPGN